ncbi:MAG: GNAT family N-acetyltransferase [Thermoplasmata archaeon]
MVERLRFRLKARSILCTDPLRNALPLHRVFHTPVGENEILVDNMEEPRALMTKSRRDPTLVSMAGNEGEAVRRLLNHLESEKECRFHALDNGIANLIRESFTVLQDRPSWFYTLAKKDLKGEVRHEVTPLRPEDAETINRYWNPGEDSTPYIRRRIEQGLSFGIRVDGDLVAWDASHLETDQAVMLGFLYVKEGFRHRGFAKSVTATMVRAVFERGKTPICHVFTDNEPSMRLTEEMGFRRRGQQVWLKAVRQ